MAQVRPEITSDLAEFIERQPLFFVASAPLSADGHINLSPKGLDCFAILDPLRVAYLDLTGSGNETAAHLLENGRITFMFCAFDGPPMILRLYGQGRLIAPSHPEWDALQVHFPAYPGARHIVEARVSRVQTSCGFGVPFMDYRAQRDQLPRWAARKGADGLARYREEKNARSIDGLPTGTAPAS